MKVFLYGDFRDYLLAVLRHIFEWLAVDSTFTPSVDQRCNVASVTKSATGGQRPPGNLVDEVDVEDDDPGVDVPVGQVRP